MWRPLFDSRPDVMSSVEAVADGLLQRYSKPSTAIDPADLADAALFLSYLARTNAGYGAHSRELLQRAMVLAASATVPPWLHGGLLGIAWVHCHMCGPDRDDDVYEDIDAALSEHLQGRWQGPYDLVHGLVGVGAYLLPRATSTPVRAALATVCRQLDDVTTDIVAASGPGDTHSFRETPIALGMAHGIAGVIAFLCATVRSKGSDTCAVDLMRRLSSWMTSESMPGPHAFARFAGADFRNDTFFGWCWGDLGIALALYQASDVLADRALRDFSIGIATRAARQRAQPARDVSLCHGAAGHAHCFNRLYAWTDMDVFREAASYWLEIAVAFRRPATGPTGFARLDRDTQGARHWVEDHGFLLGSPGIALALLAACSDDEPAWDARLLVGA